MSLPDREPKGLTRRDFIRGVLGSLGLAAAGPIISACASKLESPGTVMAGVAATPAATATGTSTPRPSPTATETPVTPTPTGTATPEALPTAKPTIEPTKEVEKSPLPRYAGYLGNVIDGKTGTNKGKIVIASIPEVGTGVEESVYVALYWQEAGSQMTNSFAFRALAEQVKPDGAFTAMMPSKGWRIEVLSNKSGELSGKVIQGRPDTTPTWQSDFKVKLLTGRGKDVVIAGIKTAKKIQTNLGDVPVSAVKIDELRRYVNFDLWPKE